MIGLSTAVELAARGHAVTVYAAAAGVATTSAIAGAIWLPTGLDFPEPDRPVITIKLSRGRSISTPLRLCSRAPRTEIFVSAMKEACSRIVRLGQVPWGTRKVPFPQQSGRAVILFRRCGKPRPIYNA